MFALYKSLPTKNEAEKLYPESQLFVTSSDTAILCLVIFLVSALILSFFPQHFKM